MKHECTRTAMARILKRDAAIARSKGPMGCVTWAPILAEEIAEMLGEQGCGCQACPTQVITEHDPGDEA